MDQDEDEGGRPPDTHRGLLVAEDYHGVHERLIDRLGTKGDALYTFVGTQAEGQSDVDFQHAEGSLEEAVEELKSRGVEFPTEISEHDWGRVATFTDSEGNDLRLYEPPSS